MCHTDLQQDISRSSFLHQIERVLFRASFSCEFLVRVSCASVMRLMKNGDMRVCATDDILNNIKEASST